MPTQGRPGVAENAIEYPCPQTGPPLRHVRSYTCQRQEARPSGEYAWTVTLALTTAGESHGPALVAILTGLPAGLVLDREAIDADLHRRQQGYGRSPRQQLEQDRVEVLAALSSIDHIVAFDEDTAVELCGAVRPHVFVKGGDYTRERLPEAVVVESQGGEVRILPYLRDRSTSSIIERVRAGQQPVALGRPA